MNEDPKARLIRELRAEIARLRSEQGGKGGMGDDVSTMQEILDLRKALQVGELTSSFSCANGQLFLSIYKMYLIFPPQPIKHFS